MSVYLIEDERTGATDGYYSTRPRAQQARLDLRKRYPSASWRIKEVEHAKPIPAHRHVEVLLGGRGDGYFSGA